MFWIIDIFTDFQKHVDKLNANEEDSSDVFTNRAGVINHNDNTEADDNMSDNSFNHNLLLDRVKVNNSNYTNETFNEKNETMCNSPDSSLLTNKDNYKVNQ